jgi:hypothetical protein
MLSCEWTSQARLGVAGLEDLVELPFPVSGQAVSAIIAVVSKMSLCR